MRQGEIRLPQTESRRVTTSRADEIRVLLETDRKKLKESATMNRRTFLGALSGPGSVRRVGAHVEARRLWGRPVVLALIVVAAFMAVSSVAAQSRSSVDIQAQIRKSAELQRQAVAAPQEGP